MTTAQVQKDITAYIEKSLFVLTSKADVKQFEQIIQQNVNQKRESAKTTEDFYDRLMLNIAFFVDNKTAWVDIVRATYGSGQVPKMSNTNMVVLMSVYKNDNPEHLRLSVESILNQTYQEFLLLVGVDGAVSGELEEVLHGYEADARVKVFWFKDNRGLTAVLNNLLEEGKKMQPKYLARMDADDISKTDRFEKQVKYLEAHPELDVIGGAIEEMEYDGQLNGKVINNTCN